MSLRSWTWFDEELENISSLSSRASSTLTLNKPPDHVLSGFLISFTDDASTTRDVSSHDDVNSRSEVLDQGYQSQSKSEERTLQQEAKYYDCDESSGNVLDIDLAMQNSELTSVTPLPGRRLPASLYSTVCNLDDIRDIDNSGGYLDNYPVHLDNTSGNLDNHEGYLDIHGGYYPEHHSDVEDNTFSCDFGSSFPSSVKEFSVTPDSQLGNTNPDSELGNTTTLPSYRVQCYERLYFGSQDDLELGNPRSEVSSVV